MITVFFFYGLAFIVMGIVILAMPKRNDFLNLSSDLWLVGLFGIIHGLNEWVDLFILRGEPFNVEILKIIGVLTLPISFVFLIVFSVQVITRYKRELKWLKFLWIICLSVWALSYILSRDFLIAGIAARYFICVPGTFLTAFALTLKLSKLDKKEVPKIVYVSTQLAVFTFVLYGVFSGIIVPKADFLFASTINHPNFSNFFRMPVQFFRMLCAAILAVSFFEIVGLFSYKKGKAKLRGGIRRKISLLICLFVFIVAALCINFGYFWGSNLLRNKEVFAPLGTFIFQVIILAGFLIIILISMGFFLSGLFTGQIKKLYNATQKIAEGDLDYKIEVKTGDEIEELADSFKDMVSKIKGEQKEILQEIERRKDAEGSLKKAYTELKETQNQLIQAEKMEVVGRLASGVAHEVKNPLATILQSTDYLEKKVLSDDENISLSLGYIRDAVEKADNVVRGLLDFSSLSKLDMQLFNLNLIIEKSLFLTKHQFDKNHIQVIEDFRKDIPDVKIDKNRIEQVFINLFLNAVAAMPNGGKLIVKSYAEEIEKRERMVIVQIEDTGIGIPEDILNKIFDPFFTTRRASGGTGLGLSIVKNIIELHNGKIAIQNKKDKGGIRVTLFFKV